MQAKPVVIAIYEFRQLLMQGFEVGVSSRIDLFTFERPQKALTSGVVIRIRGSAYARYHPMLVECLHVFPANVLHSLVGVVHDSRRWPAVGNCLLQCAK